MKHSFLLATISDNCKACKNLRSYMQGEKSAFALGFSILLTLTVLVYFAVNFMNVCCQSV